MLSRIIKWREHRLYSYAYSEYRLSQQKIIRLMEKYAHGHLKVLDIGCGTGNL
jgi:ubiquinone/menaquinone biosynthesis C-methylase UbiE